MLILSDSFILLWLGVKGMPKHTHSLNKAAVVMLCRRNVALRLSPERTATVSGWFCCDVRAARGGGLICRTAAVPAEVRYRRSVSPTASWAIWRRLKVRWLCEWGAVVQARVTHQWRRARISSLLLLPLLLLTATSWYDAAATLRTRRATSR